VKGRWVELDVAWHDTNVGHCSVCGRLVTRRAWVFDGGRGEIAVCEPDCEELYATYWKPTYGAMEATDDHHRR
jgi:hypothetical protein